MNVTITELLDKRENEDQIYTIILMLRKHKLRKREAICPGSPSWNW